VIQALETHYKGCRFRSRLEARHAIFFDMIEVEWRYEMEGFQLGGSRYLPDFFLPKLGLWLEVKGEYPNADEVGKAMDLSNGTGKPIAISVGDPYYGQLLVYCPLALNDGSGGCAWFEDEGTVHRGSGYIWIGPKPCEVRWAYNKERRGFGIQISAGSYWFFGAKDGTRCPGINDSGEYRQLLKQAADGARGRRFGT
jgi:hypothetical protein